MTKILFVGDTHANNFWLQEAVLRQAYEYNVDKIIQLGDFGYWPKGENAKKFLITAQKSEIPIWWLDGNHEDHWALKSGVKLNVNKLLYLPRGFRFYIGGYSVVVCGGAASIDKGVRVAGRDWFPDEYITEEDVENCVSGGHADVLLCHDAPSGWEIPNIPSNHGLPVMYQQELPACMKSRQMLREIMDAVTPTLVIHGHYHSYYDYEIKMPWGIARVMGLSNDMTTDNMAIYKDGELTKLEYKLPVEPEGLWHYKRKDDS